MKHIDLSVGYVAGFTGALAAILMQRYGVNEWIAILLVLLVGLVIGLYQGFTVTRLGVPAFVVTLAGMFIFRGLLSRTLAESGTIVVSQKGFLALCNGFIPDIPNGLGIHLVTMIVGVLGVIIVILSQIANRKNKQKYQFEVVSTPIFVVEMIQFLLFMLGNVFSCPCGICKNANRMKEMSTMKACVILYCKI